MLYPQEVIEEVRLGNDIVSVISSYVSLKQKGGTHFGLCPFHNEKSPSFSVSPDKQIFKCFGCGVAGNVFSFIMQMENYEFVEALKFLANRINYRLPEADNSLEAKHNAALRDKLLEANRIAARYFYDNLKAEEGRIAVNYMDKRNILHNARIKFGLGYSSKKRKDLYDHLVNHNVDSEVIQKSGLVIADKNGGYFDRFSGRLMFPIFDVAGKVVGFGGRILDDGEPKYLNSPETMLFNKSRNLYGINYARASRTKEFVLVEGYMDTLSLHQAGFTNAVAALGTAFNNEHVKLIRRYADSVIILFDSDEAGTIAAERAIPILRSGGLKIKILQVKDAKDPDEYILKFGAEAFGKLLASANNHITFQVGNLQKKHDIKSTDGKINFTSDVSKLLSGLESAIERDVFTNEVSELTGISGQAIRAEIDKAASKPIEISNSATKKNAVYIRSNELKEKGIGEAKKNIIYLITESHYLYQKLKDTLRPDEMRDPVYEKLLSLIYDFHAKRSNIYAAELLNYFGTADEQKLVTDVMVSSIKSDEDYSLERTVNDLVKKIKRHNIDERLILTKDEFEIKKLIELKRNLEELYITISDG